MHACTPLCMLWAWSVQACTQSPRGIVRGIASEKVLRSGVLPLWGFDWNVTANSLRTDRLDPHAPVENLGGENRDLQNGLDVRADVP